MEDEIIMENIEFLMDQDIIYCKPYNNFDVRYQVKDIEALLHNVITRLAYGKYVPILFNLRELDNADTIKLYNLIESSGLIKSSVLVKTYLVSSFPLKVYLSLYDFTRNPIVPNKICKNLNLAVNHCRKRYNAFNALN